MNQELYSTSVQELIQSAALQAQAQKNPTLLPVHLLYAGLQNEFCRSFFKVLSLNIETLSVLVDEALAKLPKAVGTQLVVDRSLEEFLNACAREAQARDDSYVTLEHLILIWCTGSFLSESLQDYFKKSGCTKKAIEEHMHTLRKGKKVTEKNAEKQYQMLEKYCLNVTKQAREGTLDPVIGRHEEIRRVLQILSRRTKNNPVLIGEPGVGKTAIVEGIAQRIINNDVPESIKNSTLYSLDLGALIAGAKHQGEFEERLKGVLKDIEESQDNVIIFIDELHMLVGTGATGGGMDASNLLKPALARGTLHCIGATTIKEYKKYIEKDAALERRFQKVLVEEPTIEDAISILRGLKEKYELHHGIRIKDQALVDAVILSSKNIPERFLPDKAIDLVDEAAAMVKMAIDSQPVELDHLERKIRQLEIEKVALGKEKDNEASAKRLSELEQELATLKENFQTLLNQWKSEKAPLESISKVKEQIEKAQQQFIQAERLGDFAKASEIKYGTLAKLQTKLDEEQKKLTTLKTQLIKEEVDEQDIAAVLSRWTGIPVKKLQTSESQKLLTMSALLEKRIIGQQEAIKVVSHAIQMQRTGLTDPHRPIGSFLFLGPTGVGKTEVAKSLADFLFDDPKKLVRIDMSEYMEKHSVARLIGAPPGYIGYEEGGQLTEAVRRNPYCVLLIDEIEKAHPDVFNLFLQILDEGHLTDGQGRTISFKSCIIIMTSNLGSSFIIEAKKIDDTVKKDIEKLLYSHFKPEFLNRLDAIVYFTMLSPQDVRLIAQLQIDQLTQRLADKNIELTVSAEALAKVADLGYETEFGARPLKRAVQQYLSVPLSQYILGHPDDKKLEVIVEDDSFKVIKG